MTRPAEITTSQRSSEAGGWFQYPIVGWTTGVLAIGKRVGGVTTILAAQNMGFGSGKLECSVCGQELVARVMGGDLTTPWDYAENLELGYPVLEVSDTDIPSGTFGGMLGEGDGNTDVGGPMFPRITSWIQQADADKTILVVDASGNVYAVDRINAGPGEVFVEMFGALDFDQYATANQGDSALLLGAFSGCATGCTAACTAGCTASCTATCTSGCTASCTTGCEGNCEAACQTACETQACQTFLRDAELSGGLHRGLHVLLYDRLHFRVYGRLRDSLRIQRVSGRLHGGLHGGVHRGLYGLLHRRLHEQLHGGLYEFLHERLHGHLRRRVRERLYDGLHCRLYGQLHGRLYLRVHG